MTNITFLEQSAVHTYLSLAALGPPSYTAKM